MRKGLREWHRVCGACSHESACLPVCIDDSAATHGRLDEVAREQALSALRRDNNRKVLRCIRQVGYGSGRLLDVGAGHGWLLEAARNEFDCLGIEPDHRLCEAARARGLPVVDGFFPAALDADQRFDVIVFNDVFEHLADAAAILSAVRRHLVSGGLLLINAPNRKGVIYKVSKLLARIGATRFFDRMWQVGLPSPHLHYFDRAGLSRLLRAAGLVHERSERLPAIRLRGLAPRIRYTNDAGWPLVVLLFTLAALAAPLLHLLPSDAVVVFSRLEQPGASPAVPG